MNRGNDDFSYNLKNIKNPVDNVNRNVTPGSAHKTNINTNISVNDSNNNFATPANIFNRDDEKKTCSKFQHFH